MKDPEYRSITMIVGLTEVITVYGGIQCITVVKLATESLSKTTKVTKMAHIFTCSLLYNSNFVNFVKNDNELNLSSVGFVTFDKHKLTNL